MRAGEAGLAVRGDGVGPHVPVDVHGRLSRRNVRHHHPGADALRHARPTRDGPLTSNAGRRAIEIQIRAAAIYDSFELFEASRFDLRFD